MTTHHVLREVEMNFLDWISRVTDDGRAPVVTGDAFSHKPAWAKGRVDERQLWREGYVDMDEYPHPTGVGMAWCLELRHPAIDVVRAYRAHHGDTTPVTPARNRF